jgi:hypothetical protein
MDERLKFIARSLDGEKMAGLMSGVHQSAENQSQYCVRRSKRRHQTGERPHWLVTFIDYDLGYFDHQTCRLEPLDNPFGPKVLPMSPV